MASALVYVKIGLSKIFSKINTDGTVIWSYNGNNISKDSLIFIKASAQDISFGPEYQPGTLWLFAQDQLHSLNALSLLYFSNQSVNSISDYPSADQALKYLVTQSKDFIKKDDLIDVDTSTLKSDLLQFGLSAISSPKVGQCYFNTTEKTIMVWDGSNWQDTSKVSEIIEAMEELIKDYVGDNEDIPTGGGAGIKSIELSIDSSTYIMSASVTDDNGETYTSNKIDLPLETMVINGSFNKQTLQIILTLKNGSEIAFSVGELVNGLYSKPEGGIPKSDLSNDVKNSLDKADTALQEHQSLSGYATESWVDGKGYLTTHQSLTVKKYNFSTASDVSIKQPIYTLNAVNHLNWGSQNDALINKGALAYWNGRYNNESSNLLYFKNGEIDSVSARNTAITNAINALDVASAGGDGKYIQSISETDGKISATAATLNKAAVGLGNVDNTSDANKPISSATQTALDGKRSNTAPKSGAWFAGTPQIGNDGVMEIGRYIDFHPSSASTSDYGCRLDSGTSTTLHVLTLPDKTGTLALTTDTIAKATDADTVDGLHSSSFQRLYQYIQYQFVRSSTNITEATTGKYKKICTIKNTGNYLQGGLAFDAYSGGYSSTAGGKVGTFSVYWASGGNANLSMVAMYNEWSLALPAANMTFQTNGSTGKSGFVINKISDAEYEIWYHNGIWDSLMQLYCVYQLLSSGTSITWDGNTISYDKLLSNPQYPGMRSLQNNAATASTASKANSVQVLGNSDSTATFSLPWLSNGVVYTTPNYDFQPSTRTIKAGNIHLSGGADGRSVKVTNDALQFIATSSNGWSMALAARNHADNTTLDVLIGGYGNADTYNYTYLGGTYNNPKMVIKDGKIGIGTTTPAQKLHVAGNIYGTGLIQALGDIWVGAKKGDATAIYVDGYKKLSASPNYNNATNFFGDGMGFQSQQADVVMMQLHATVGISNNYIDRPFQLKQGAKFKNICIECDNKGENYSTRGSEINNYSGNLYLQHNTSTNLLVCNGGGNVGIGTASPTYKLEVFGKILSKTSGTSEAEIKCESASANIRVLAYNNGTSWIQSSNLTSGATTHKLIISKIGGSSLTNLDVYATSASFNGNVGIGTESPQSKLDVVGDIWTDKISLKRYSNEAKSYIEPVAGEGTTALNTMQFTTEGGQGAFIFRTNTNSSVTEKVRISNSGNVGIGTSAPGAKLDVNGRILTTASTGSSAGGGINIGNCKILQLTDSLILDSTDIRFGGKDVWDWSKWAGLKYDSGSKKIYLGIADGKIFATNPSTAVQTGGTIETVNCSIKTNGNITATGTVTASAFYQQSDDRIKTYTGNLNLTLEQILSIPRKYFYFNDDDTQTTHIGTSAQSLEKICPELVTESDGIKKVNYAGLSIVALDAVHELNDTVVDLKKTVSDLQERLSKIEALLNI